MNNARILDLVLEILLALVIYFMNDTLFLLSNALIHTFIRKLFLILTFRTKESDWCLREMSRWVAPTERSF